MNYHIPEKECEVKLEAKNSRFLGGLMPVSSKDEAEVKLAEVKARFSDATHNCWAYRVFESGRVHQRSSDDGEPSGTAGKPILESMEEREVCDALLVVTRYFGGVKLGVGGLSRAYRQTARMVISKANLILKTEQITFELNFPYNFESYVRKLISTFKGEVLGHEYGERSFLKIIIPKAQEFDFKEKCNEICKGEVIIREPIFGK
jgi:uncharacterized YigZ family protein